MKYAFNVSFLIFILYPLTALGFDSAEEILRTSVINNGLQPPESLNIKTNPALSEIGSQLFASKKLSLNGETSCQACHLDEFGSSDGIPNSIGIGGQGMGSERILSGGAIIPRNSLALWGTGGKNFNVLFWDGRVDFSGKNKISQFGDHPPSLDPLVVATHLPPLVIREMLQEDEFIKNNKKESLSSAEAVFVKIIENLRNKEPNLLKELSAQLKVPESKISFTHVAIAISEFIRTKFALKKTKFHKFVFDREPLTDTEFRGAMLFYGKGKCATCHSGPYLSDFEFHALAAPQLGFGSNGFGIDYGRFNITHDVTDLYKFRTPPLFNVTKTAPYGHSGSIMDLDKIITVHFDPLKEINTKSLTKNERIELYKRITAASKDIMLIATLSKKDVAQIREFLTTLSFE